MPIQRLMVANRGEIAIRIFRAAHELGLATIAIYTHEDRFALHRFKADEAYPIGKPGEPVRSYIHIEEVIAIARAHEVDAIHPGYGFLSENADFARACEEAGIQFVGPRSEVLANLGNKVVARSIAKQAGIPILEGSPEPVSEEREALALAQRLGYPVILKAAHGGGGRGMRVVRSADELGHALEQARREARQAFGKEDVFIEKYIQRARHLEVQLIGDRHGNLLHLFERDCSIQRRHQKVAEIAPAPRLDPKLRDELCRSAIAIGRAVRLDNAGTVEFLLDEDTSRLYFIEVNPRIQVEHTVTEAVTGIDIVNTQIQIAAGERLDGPALSLGQDDIRVHGFALQCRVTSEDPSNDFAPDYGRILHYRSAGGMGIRLDGGNAFSGAIITPYFDSLLVKVTAWGHRFEIATRRMERALQEFRIRGVQTNIPFLLNLVTHEEFIQGRFTTRFLDERPELFTPRRRRDRATKLLTYLADVTVNGHPQVPRKPESVRRAPAPLPPMDLEQATPDGSKQLLDRLGPKGLADWVKARKTLLLTDTTLRDAHQSLLATRLRSDDMLRVAPLYARKLSGLFSLEMWGGATFDTAMRFLGESPWERLERLRELIPNILFQMLLRSANAVGYTTYPDNVVQAFIRGAANKGIDIFRIFDSLNWVENMRVAIDAVLETRAVCEVAICYTGDILNPARPKYDLEYYVKLAKELEKAGGHLLAIKDMSGLCKPVAAGKLIRALKQEVGIPIHFHTHDTAGVQAAAILAAAEAGVDIVDAAIAPLSGLTSQPNLNSILEALRFTDRDPALDVDSFDQAAQYWERVREFYVPFESGMLASTASVYESEIPGGQWTNLQQQAKGLGLGEQFPKVLAMYAEVNRLFGDIVKVTPTSKVVGDMALYMVANNLTPAEVLDPAREIAFPESVVEMFEGRLGQPLGGWPAELQKKILRGRPPMTGRPGAELPPADLSAAAQAVENLTGSTPEFCDVLSYLLYPKVFADWVGFREKYSDVSVLPTPLFFYGLVPGEEVGVDIEPGKTLILKLTAIGEPHADGYREVFFELNGQPRDIKIFDKEFGTEVQKQVSADPNNPKHVGSPMPGLVSTVLVSAGDPITRGQKLATIEAMKMETTLYAEREGTLESVLVSAGQQVQAGDLLFVYE